MSYTSQTIILPAEPLGPSVYQIPDCDPSWVNGKQSFKKLCPLLHRLCLNTRLVNALSPPEPTLPPPRPPTPRLECSLEACKGNVGGILQSNSCEGLALLSGEGFLRLQLSPQLCSARYLWQQIILNVLHGSQLLRQESTTGSSCMLNSLLFKRELNLLHICSLEGRVHVCLHACIRVWVCVRQPPPPPSSNRLR